MADVAILASWKMRAPNEAHPSPRGVCRALFGRASDPQENVEFARREQKQIVRQQTRRWNFDFRTGTPLQVEGGRFAWTKVESGENVHAAYGLCRMPFCGTQQETVSDSDRTDPKDPASSSSTVVEPSTSASASPVTTSLKQTNISDYMKTRKRKQPSSSSTSSKSTTGESSSSPKTPKIHKRTLSS